MAVRQNDAVENWSLKNIYKKSRLKVVRNFVDRRHTSMRDEYLTPIDRKVAVV